MTVESRGKIMNKCVLVVDDNDFNRELVRDILEDEDIVVYEAADGKSAVDFMESQDGTNVNAILMDLRMPVMDGMEATRVIRQGSRGSVPIIAMTANSFETDKDYGGNTPCHFSYLESPIKKRATVPGPECVPIVGHI